MIQFTKDISDDIPIGHGSQYELKKDAAIAALLKNANIEQAAKAVDVDAQTLRRWLKIPDFRNTYRAARRELFAECVAGLQWASSIAVQTLTEIMLDTTFSASSRVRAAETVLNHVRQGMEVEDLLVRIEALEAAKEAEAA